MLKQFSHNMLEENTLQGVALSRWVSSLFRTLTEAVNGSDLLRLIATPVLFLSNQWSGMLLSHL